MNEEKAARYQRLNRRARLVSLTGGAALLLILLGTGLSSWLRDIAVRLTAAGPSSAPAAAVYAILCAAIARTAALPVAAYRTHALERRFGLSSGPLHVWLADYAKASVLLVVVAFTAALVISLCMRLWPAMWWIPAAAVFSGAAVTATRFAAVPLLRVFHRVEPLDSPTLRRRLLTLSARAGVAIVDVVVLRLGSTTSRASAALVGLGRARRIVLSDTLLESFSEAEIEVVLAHELGHHAGRDLLRILALDITLITVALAAGAASIAAAWQSLGLSSPSDVAGFPLIFSGALAVSVIARPALNAFSRGLERRADRYALSLTNHPAAFISTMRRFAARNLAEERPSRLALWIFHSHPAFAERIRMAEDYRKSGDQEG